MTTAICLSEDERLALLQKYSDDAPPPRPLALSKLSLVTGKRYPSKDLAFTPITMGQKERREAIMAAYRSGVPMPLIAQRYGGTAVGVAGLARKHGARRDTRQLGYGQTSNQIVSWVLAFPELSDIELSEQGCPGDRSYIGQVRRELGIPAAKTLLNIERRARIVELEKSGLTHQKIGEQLGISKNTVSGILYRVRSGQNTDGGL